MPVHAVAHSASISPPRRSTRPDVGRVDRAVADHPRRIVGRSARRRRLVEMPVRVVAGQQLGRRRAALDDAIDPAVADPRDEPSRQRGIRWRRRAPRWRRRGRRCGARCCAAMWRSASRTARRTIASSMRPRAEHRVEVCDELAAGARRHRARTHAVGDDEQRRRCRRAGCARPRSPHGARRATRPRPCAGAAMARCHDGFAHEGRARRALAARSPNGAQAFAKTHRGKVPFVMRETTMSAHRPRSTCRRGATSHRPSSANSHPDRTTRRSTRRRCRRGRRHRHLRHRAPRSRGAVPTLRYAPRRLRVPGCANDRRETAERPGRARRYARPRPCAPRSSTRACACAAARSA